MYRKSVGFLSIFSICLLAVLTACGGGSSSANQNRLVVAMEADAVSLDPHLSNVTISSQFNVHMFETLVQLDADGEPFGVLAETWERVSSDDDEFTVYEFTLRQGVQFHGGFGEMTAADVAFSIGRAADAPAVAAIMGDFDSTNIEIIDDHTIRIGTSEPFAPFINNISHPAGAILSEAAFNELGEEGFGENPTGTGPFEFYNRVHGDFVEFRRFEDYHGEAPAIDELVLRAVTEPSVRLIQLESGEVDVAFIGRSDMAAVEGDANLNLERMTNYQIFYVGLSTDRIPDVRVRQAISYAIDTELIRSTLMYDMGEAMNGILTSNVFAARTDLPGFETNQDRARELLAEAGYGDGLNLTMTSNEFPERIEWGQAVQSQLAAVGITVDFQHHQNAIFIEETAEGNYDMFVLAWTTVTGDADYGIFPLLHPDNFGAPGNRTFFDHPRATELMELGRTTFDPAERIEIYHELQQIIHDEAPFVTLSSGELVLAARDGVVGLRDAMGPANHVRFQRVNFE